MLKLDKYPGMRLDIDGEPGPKVDGKVTISTAYADFGVTGSSHDIDPRTNFTIKTRPGGEFLFLMPRRDSDPTVVVVVKRGATNARLPGGYLNDDEPSICYPKKIMEETGIEFDFGDTVRLKTVPGHPPNIETPIVIYATTKFKPGVTPNGIRIFQVPYPRPLERNSNTRSLTTPVSSGSC